MEESSSYEKIRGYIDLKMFDEAWSAIEDLPPEDRSSPDTQELRIIIMLDQGRIHDAWKLSAILSDLHPDNNAGFIQGAWCLHASGETERAIEHLNSGPPSLKEEPVYFYNLACYELALGKKQAALTWLKRSFEMDPSSRAKALEDPDLSCLREAILNRD